MASSQTPIDSSIICDFPGCMPDKLFSRISDLNRHKREVHGNRKICSFPDCLYTTKRTGRVRKHEFKKHGHSLGRAPVGRVAPAHLQNVIEAGAGVQVAMCPNLQQAIPIHPDVPPQSWVRSSSSRISQSPAHSLPPASLSSSNDLYYPHQLFALPEELNSPEGQYLPVQEALTTSDGFHASDNNMTFSAAGGAPPPPSDTCDQDTVPQESNSWSAYLHTPLGDDFYNPPVDAIGSPSSNHKSSSYTSGTPNSTAMNPPMTTVATPVVTSDMPLQNSSWLPSTPASGPQPYGTVPNAYTSSNNSSDVVGCGCRFGRDGGVVGSCSVCQHRPA